MKNDYDPRMGFLTVFMSGIVGLIFIGLAIAATAYWWPWSWFVLYFGAYGLGKYFGIFK